ncbi:ENO1, partial [Lemmus lemmus]
YIVPALVNKKLNVEQEKADKLSIEISVNKSKFGGKVILNTSFAVCKTSAMEKGVPLYHHITDLAGNQPHSHPVILAFNMINSSAQIDNKLAMQKCVIIPVGAFRHSASERP